MCALILAGADRTTKGIEDRAFCVFSSAARWGSLSDSWFVFALADGLEMVHSSTVSTCLSVGGAVTLSDLGGGILAMAMFAAV